mmetsp:Transcript_28837/g.21476  ORF Transcript_28837/g.21476 Transcript_28837/m.21476 type:complete len:109 (-) Transcript_28837:155-481(-)|eukprot:CAMPEP_0202965350 /NCGR_PEP_ID=MMETSP1396-20130829/9355_1 /ASSEMBLY_ACC=CAM_ASM_000872 /TAXON_ID= /ORGANISM="Pseudokeronopsis sp., Strain Brazil" /LENGTH=108 /DNA_ID=CAMNT_0049688035 /DNA_START=344 /DNA_END=670 /DNA_ORIENTATION=+
MPIVVINDMYIGGYKEVQDLVDDQWLLPILNREYEDQCLRCFVTRESMKDSTCKYCEQKYLFFQKKAETYEEKFFQRKNIFEVANVDAEEEKHLQGPDSLTRRSSTMN